MCVRIKPQAIQLLPLLSFKIRTVFTKEKYAKNNRQLFSREKEWVRKRGEMESSVKRLTPPEFIVFELDNNRVAVYAVCNEFQL